MLTVEIMRAMWPRGDSVVAGLIDGVVANAPATLAEFSLDSPLVVAHAMAQFSHECGAGTEMVENLNYSAQGLMNTWPSRFDAATAAQFARKPREIANKVYNGRMGNKPGSDDGWNFRGRGGAQVTGREGYTRLAARTGLDLLSDADLEQSPFEMNRM